jgi:histidinol phosphatase-like enzyme (inositol monophosphatase family)
MAARVTLTLSEAANFAHRLADEAARVIMPHFRASGAVADKGAAESGAAFDPVTEADRAAERAMRSAIEAAYPDHGVFGEEYGVLQPGAEWCWTLDPIDGTRAFITGFPLWGVLIGLKHEGAPVFGLMDQPFTGERFFSTETGAMLRSGGEDRAMRTRACPALAEAALMTTSPDLLADGHEREAFDRLKREAKLTRFGGDCYSYCMLAAGHVDLVIEAGLKSYDILPLIPIVEKAGGRLTAWDGGDASLGGRVIAAGDARAHEEAMKILNG